MYVIPFARLPSLAACPIMVAVFTDAIRNSCPGGYRLMPSPQTPGSPWTLSPFPPP
jgi:hypothetical protein